MPIYVNPIEPDEDDDDEPSTIAEAIEENAKGPKSVFVDGERVEQHSITDQIKADQYVNAQEAASNNRFPLKRFKISSPSST